MDPFSLAMLNWQTVTERDEKINIPPVHEIDIYQYFMETVSVYTQKNKQKTAEILQSIGLRLIFFNQIDFVYFTSDI